MKRVGYLISDLAFWLRQHAGRAVIGLLLLAGVGVGGSLGISALGDDAPAPAPAPRVIVRTEEAPEQTADLGFPAFATRNTTRISGADPIADAAAAALAVNPSTGGLKGPPAVTLVDAADWPGGIAAAALVAAPLGAPILLTDGGETPSLTADALSSLDPQGSASTGDAQVFQVGSSAGSPGATTKRATGATPAKLGAAVARLREKLTGGAPAHIVVVSSDQPEFAMPAAAWAARSGDAVLFAQHDSAPTATLKTIERYRSAGVYVLGPESVISKKAFGQIDDATGSVTRVSGEDPVSNAVEFARFADGGFGWNLNDPGHGFVIANASRPADAAAAAPLSASGTWGPLLLTDNANALPAELEGYLLDLKPGYETDPTRALYNHLWLIGDESAISVEVQAQLDEIAEVAPIRSGPGDASVLGPAPGTPEPEAPTRKDTTKK